MKRAYTRADVIAELRRELGVRRRVYPGWVRNGKHTQQMADERLELMQMAIELLSVGMEKVEQTSLF
jgi:hypothetical protein